MDRFQAGWEKAPRLGRVIGGSSLLSYAQMVRLLTEVSRHMSSASRHNATPGPVTQVRGDSAVRPDLDEWLPKRWVIGVDAILYHVQELPQ